MSDAYRTYVPAILTRLPGTTSRVWRRAPRFRGHHGGTGGVGNVIIGMCESLQSLLG